MLYLCGAFRGGDFGGLAAVEGVELAFRFLIQVINAGVNVVVFIGIAIADLFPQVSLDGVVAGFFAVVAIVVIVVAFLHPPGQLLGGQAVGKGLGKLGTVSIIHAADIFLSAKIHRGKFPACVPGGERTRRAKEWLERVGMGERMKHQPNELSGGQKQRVAIARAMVNEPALILADEPTGALDSQTSRTVMDLFHEMHNTYHKTIVLITHNPELADECERVLTLRDGLIVGERKGSGKRAAL